MENGELMAPARTKKEILAELEELRARLEEAEETLRAIRSGEVDALVVSGPEGDQIYTLKGAEHSYRVLLENLEEGAATLTPEGGVLYCNQSLAKMLGAPLERMIGRSLQDFLDAQDRPTFSALLERGKEDYSRGEVWFRRGEDKFPAFVSLASLREVDLPGISLIVADLTEQKRNEKIFSAERLSRSILEQAAESIIVCDEQGRIIRASQVTDAIAGKGLMGKHFDAMLPLRLLPAGSIAPPFSVSSVLQGQTFHSTEVLLTRNGNELFFLLSARPLRDQSNRILGAVLVLTDLTRRKQIEKRLREAKEAAERQAAEFQAIFSSLTDAVLVLNPEGLPVRANPRVVELTGLDPLNHKMNREGLVRRFSMRHPDGSSLSVEELPGSRALRGEQVLNEGLSFRNLKGRKLTIQISASPIRQAGKITGAVVTFHDVTERDRLQRELEKERTNLQRANEELAAQAEELRQQTGELSKIRDQLEARVLVRTAELVDANRALRQSEERMRRLSSELLLAQEKERKLIAQELHDSIGANLAAIKYSLERKLGQMRGDIHSGGITVEEIVTIVQKGIEETRRIMANLRPSILDDLGVLPTIAWFSREFQSIYPHIRVEKEIQIQEKEIPEPLKIVIFRFLQEAMNNTAKHSQATCARILLAAGNGKMELAITDNGLGFDPGEGFSARRMGHGLGLSSMKERVELSGGKFLLESNPRKGTSVRAEWPIPQG